MIKRPLLWILAAYVAGILMAWQELSIIIIITLMFGIFLIIYFLMYHIKNPWINHKDTFLWSFPFLLLLGFLATRSQLRMPKIYAQFEQECSCQLEGQITMIVEKSWGRALYVKNNEVLLPTVNPYQTFLCEKIIVYTSDDQIYHVGNHISVLGKLKKFQRPSNPGQFNEQLYYQIENITLKLEAEQVTVIDHSYSEYHTVLNQIKGKLITVYSSILGEKEAGTLIAMLLGEKYLLEDEIKQLYQINGVSHLLAISGLHISLIGLFIFKLLRRCKLPITLTTFLTIFFIYSYGLLTNFSVSTNRAIVMMVISLLSTLLGKTYDSLSAMALSAFLILLQNPLQILSAGFLLSFGAVMGIAVVYPALQKLIKISNPIIDSLLISTSAQITTMPIVLYFFYQVPVYSIVTNLIILPFVTILTLTSIIAGIAGILYLPLGIFLIGGSNYILKFYEAVCHLGRKLPGNLITVGQPSFLKLGAYTILILIFLWACGKAQKKRLILLPMLAAFILFLPISTTGLKVTFLDVGQGDAIYIESDTGTNYLVDGGSSDIRRVGKYRLEPFLLSQGRSSLDYILITHPDNDHISGILELMENGVITVKQLVLPFVREKGEAYIQLEERAKNNGTKLQYLKAGDMIMDGELYIFCLHPSVSYIPTSTNSYSTVLSISYGEYQMLLTGDLLEDGEKIILDYLQSDASWNGYPVRPAIDYDVLKVAHHGSKNSTSEKFLQFVQPEISIISCGKNNRYGHPHQELLERLNYMGSKELITYESGAITIKTDGNKMMIEEYLASFADFTTKIGRFAT